MNLTLANSVHEGCKFVEYIYSTPGIKHNLKHKNTRINYKNDTAVCMENH
jgi:hypothetical protein